MYVIIAETAHGREEIDTADTLAQAEYLVAEYQMAYGEGIRVTCEEED